MLFPFASETRQLALRERLSILEWWISCAEIMFDIGYVVEARARTGELLGFERTANLSTQSAESIVHAAQDFGQEDDIRVLTVSRSPQQA
jgi:hypothetical protein